MKAHPKVPVLSLLIKYVFTFVSGCCPLQSLCNVTSISTSIERSSGTDFWQLQVGRSTTVHVFLTWIPPPPF